MAERAVSVALLGRADEARAQLRAALDELGASVVMEADPSAVDLVALSASQPQVVLVNLEPGLEDAFDHLQPLFDNPSVRVVFNEADVSSQLSGWDRARWARHLAAKLLGHDSINPPRPEGAEALPDLNIMPSPGAPLTPAQMAGDVSIDGFAKEALDSADFVPSEPRLEIGEVKDSFAGALSQALNSGTQGLDDSFEDFSLDLGEIEGAMAESDIRPEVHGAKVPDAAPEVDSAIDFEFDPSVLDSALKGDDLLVSSEPTAEPADDLAEESSLSPADAGALDDALAGFNLDDDSGLTIGDLALDDEHTANLEDDADLAALAAQFDAQSEGVESLSVEVTGDFDFLSLDDDTDLAQSPDPAKDLVTEALGAAPVEVSSKPASAGFDLSGLSLEPMSDELQPVVKSEASKPSGSSGKTSFGSLDFSLEPMAEAAPETIWSGPAAHSEDEGPVASAPAESEVSDTRNGEIYRVIVLGASIGGPDALRSFLAELPANFPAMFLLAQHLDSGFFERLAEQLQKVSKLPVRMPVDGARISHGEILVLGSGERARIDRQGNLRLEEFDSRPAYSPSIDQVLRDVADTFGAQASAIVFSGMAGDAIEGAAYLVSRGGEVWVQEASSCVVSSMVDGIRNRGLSEFTGSPRELARHCIARFGNPV